MINVVTFPGLGLEFVLNRVVIEIFGRPIYWYGLIIAIGFLLGAMVSAKLAPEFSLEDDHVYDFLFFAVPAALVGLRAYFVIFYLERYKLPDGSLDWAGIFRISDGGMAIYGGIIAGVIVLIFFSNTRNINFFLLADVLTIGLILGQGIGRWGNFTNVEAYGGLTDGPWRMVSESIANDMLKKGFANEVEYQQILEGTLGVHPTFFYESMWNFVGFALLIYMTKKARKFQGQIALSYFTWYGLGRFFIEGMRTDSLYFFGLKFMGNDLRTSQMLSLGIFLVAGTFLILGHQQKLSFLAPLKQGIGSDDNKDKEKKSEVNKEDSKDSKEKSKDKKEESKNSKEKSKEQKEESKNSKEKSKDKKEDSKNSKEKSKDKKEESKNSKEKSKDKKEDSKDSKEKSKDKKEDSKDTKEKSKDKKEESKDKTEVPKDQKEPTQKNKPKK
ncbi:MAG: prolipoprotein diacylglyceryl transferase [Eubacteriales bacterium]